MDITGTRLKELRTHFHMTQMQLSEKLGVTNDTVSRWERGALKISRDSLVALASSLNTSVAYLLGETDDPKRYTTLLGGDYDGAAGNPPMHDEFVKARERMGLKPAPPNSTASSPKDNRDEFDEDDPLRVASKKLLDSMTQEQLRKSYEYLSDQKRLRELEELKGA